MPETGSNILSYRGDAGLGLGSNASIPAINPNANLNAINEAGRTAMLINHENNIKLYDQKIKDRDTLYNLLSEGGIDGKNLNVLEQDRPILRKEKEAANKLFFDMVKGGGLNNTEGVIAYRDKIKEYNDAAIQANARYIGIKALETEKSSKVLKSQQDAYAKHIDKQLNKGFYGLVDPYQASLDFDHEKMNAASLKNALITAGQISKPETGQTSTTQWSSLTTKTDKFGNKIPTTKITTKETPLKETVGKPLKNTVPLSGVGVDANGSLSEFSKTPEKHIDYGTILANTTDAYLHDEEQQQYQTMWKDYFENGDLYSAQKAIDHANEKINQYNNELALAPDSNGYVKPFVVGQDIIVDPQSGKIKIAVPTPEFQAKMALASVDGSYVQKPEGIFNTDIAKHNIELKKLGLLTAESKAKIGALRALESERYSKSNLNYKKSKAVDNQFNPKQVFDELFTGKMETVQTTDGNTVTRVNSANLSKELQDVLGIAPINANGDYNLNPANIKFNGKQIDESLIWKGYPNWLKSPQAKKIQQETDKIPSVFDYIYSQGGDFEVEVQGKTKPKLNKYGIDEGGGGKIIRSNRLQSYINQMNEGGVKGKELIKLLSNEEGNINEQTEEFNSTKETGNANNPQ